MRSKIILWFKSTFELVARNKLITSVIALVLCLSITVTIVLTATPKDSKENNHSEIPSVSSEPEISDKNNSLVESVVDSVVESSSEPVTSSKPVASKPSVPAKPNINPSVVNTNYKYNTNSDVNNNVFLDSLIYTGYNIEKHRADGLMWVYILASQKRAKGWLSGIYYGGACTGYETNSNGLPDIELFKRKKYSLVCASYVTYVYFNYLPNVAGIDTSSLAKPDDPRLANSWYKAAQKWVQNGQAKYIEYSAGDRGIKADIKFSADIPIGSIICFQDYYKRNGHCSHVAVYAGYANGYHWVFHVGNDNGPEFCAIERMNRDPDPQWLLAIISTPTSIRFSASVEIELKDDDGAPIADAEFSLKNPINGSVLKLGKTNADGKLSYNGLSYGNYTLIESVPEGYTAVSAETAVNLSTKNNSLNVIKLVNSKKSSKVTEEETEDDNSSEHSVPSDTEE